MSRQCKCQICGKTLYTNEAYRVSFNKKNKYFCSEEEYQKDLQLKKEKENCYSVVAEIMEVPFITPMMKKEIGNLNQFYNFAIIEKTFKECEQNIKWFLSNNNSSSEYGKTRYVITIIQNNINSVAKKYKQLQNTREKELQKIQTVDVDIINISTNEVNNTSDITQWLD
jgi:YHS domain-containing protein|uniref:Uncharacterized protein n=1 Tax=Siphoviridae sp. cteLh2 TaxID=2825590 RepID=A0A8S5U5R3_9CAUD|nr:hypothetical protein [uncultured Lachnoclostridium sp.]DAF89816.1 MAG TPA: protein of unknown function (DUF3330) [Siphoviridae sp. cteLh2]